MARKRKNRGRKLSGAGHQRPVQCSQCGRLVPADKAIKVTRGISPVDSSLYRELRKQGTFISRRKETKYYCISCAIYLGIVKVRSEEERKYKAPLQALGVRKKHMPPPRIKEV